MTTKSNLYVEKLISEHPLATWMLNETLDYIPLNSESDRDLSNSAKWTMTNGSAYDEPSSLDTTPFPDSLTSRIERTYPFASTTVKAQSSLNIINSKIDFTLKSICLSGYVYIKTSNISSISYGYTHYDPTTGLTITSSKTDTITTYQYGTWVFFSHTFDLPATNATNFSPFFSFTGIGSVGTSSSDYSVLVNGLTFAQWPELFNSYSLGVYPENIAQEIALPSTLKVIPAKQYGSLENDAYYVSSSKTLYGKNFGIPLVYGSSNSTDLYPGLIQSGTTFPSLIFPGYGFLNERGKYNDYTIEMWIRINSDSLEPKKIFGPIASNDGLYIESGFLTLVVGNKFKPYYVGEWFRPMLIHIRYIAGNISVLLNGEEIISITLYEEDLNFPSEHIIESGITKSQDWLGFYTYENVHPLSIDTYSIFSYSVPKEVAKRRWVWGQAVVPLGTTNASLNARTIENDYTYSKYAVNYSYPDFAKWKQGFSNNLDTSGNALKLPDYNLPTINVGTKSLDTWYKNLNTLESSTTDKYFKFAPNSSWDQTSSYFYFESLGFLNNRMESIYGIFESTGSSQNKTLFNILNKHNGDNLLISINGTTVKYTLTLNGTSTVIKTQTITANEKFVVGINIPKLSLLPYQNISKFFENLSLLSLYVAGNSSSFFEGKIYKIGFDGQYNSRKITTTYDTNGFFNIAYSSTIFNHTANYTLVPICKFGLFFADIAVSGYWQDYMPLTYFAKYVRNNVNELVYDLDFLQFNVDYPEPIETFEVIETGSLDYVGLNEMFLDPYPRTYADLDNSYYTEWESYEELRLVETTKTYYDTSTNYIKTYVSFQNIIDGANKTLLDITNKINAYSSGIVDPEAYALPWEDSAYSVIDGSIIYPPEKNASNKAIDFNDIGIVYHIEFNVNGIYHNKVALKKMQTSSQVLNAVDFTPFGTKYGIDIYPYAKRGLYYDFKLKNPISTYKGNTPYLYLTRHSGWRLRGKFDPYLDRGISIPINTELNKDIKINSIQVWTKYTEKTFPTGEVKFLSLVTSTTTYDFYFDADQTLERAKIYAKDQTTGLIQDQFIYYINGRYSDNPYIIREEWASLSIAFGELLDFGNFVGRLNLNGPLIYNNISYYFSTNLEQEQRTQTRTWSEVNLYTWQYWYDFLPPADVLWNNVKIVSVSQFALVDPSIGYSKYIGNDRIIVDDNAGGLLVNPKNSISGSAPDSIRVYGTTEWSTSIRTAV